LVRKKQQKERKKKYEFFSFFSLTKRRRKQTLWSKTLVAATVCAVAVLRLVISAGGKVGVVVKGVASHVDVGVVMGQKVVLHLPVVGPLSDREFKVLLCDGIPEL